MIEAQRTLYERTFANQFIKMRQINLFLRKEALQTSSAFLCLPLEVRALILEELVLSEGPVDIIRDIHGHHLHDYPWHIKQAASGLDPRILETCQMLYHEGHHILYTKNRTKIYIDVR